MEYDKLRKKINKFYIDEKIPKYQTPGQLMPGVFNGLSDGNGNIWDSTLNMWVPDPNKMKFNNPSIVDLLAAESAKKFGVSFSSGDENSALGKTTTTFGNNEAVVNENTANESTNQSIGENHTNGGAAGINVGAAGLGTAAKGLSNFIGSLGGQTGQVGSKAVNAGINAAMLGNSAGAVAGIIGGAAVQTMGIVDNLTMGDKNFGAQSQAIDSTVHGVSGALISSGNPYATIAGVALEGANFLTKAGGQTVQGYDVNIENSGYGTLGHMESSSSRDWGAMIGLGGIFNKGAMERKLAKRNEQARMAMKAAEISEDIKFEQEARMNQVDNVLRNNQIALAGGVDLNSLGA